ncbi:CLUMA_CG000889, isoform A [Clunio marinus]|uniref:CLUMA_CG000889, isoform A n=1 Tax=Clunio marinus TaxID=568069 RepID=A0A1J1HLC3_9DIPT|nr:CLUMA_CG000889, isoform A [Clunio marinus]
MRWEKVVIALNFNNLIQQRMFANYDITVELTFQHSKPKHENCFHITNDANFWLAFHCSGLRKEMLWHMIPLIKLNDVEIIVWRFPNVEFVRRCFIVEILMFPL